MSSLNLTSLFVHVLTQSKEDATTVSTIKSYTFRDEDQRVNHNDMHLESCTKTFYVMFSKSKGLLVKAPSWQIAMRHVFCLALENQSVKRSLMSCDIVEIADLSSFNIRCRDKNIREVLNYAKCIDPETGTVANVKYSDIFERLALGDFDYPQVLGTVIRQSLELVPRV